MERRGGGGGERSDGGRAWLSVEVNEVQTKRWQW